ncbi:MAG: tetratricopeptide repeat protein [Candidatus Saccharicenans sp.]|nr:tetratricopeptide repeat protein [Candidatus Saccharicenans sp.]
MRQKPQFFLFLFIINFILISAVSLLAEVAVEEVVQAGRYVFYRDHADPHKYYYVPDQPRLATRRDGTPEFSFIKYTRTDSSTRGGVIHFLVTWGYTDAELRSAESALRSVDPQAKLAGPVPFKEATFQIISATAGKDGLFNRRIVGEGKAPVMPGQKAAVSIALTEEGASLLWESFKNPTSDISVQYVLKFSGITPAFQAKLKVDWDKVYTQHEIKAAAEGVIKVVKLRADLGAMLEELRQKGAIQLEVLGENENMQKLLETAYNHILQLMCDKVPTTGVSSPAIRSSLIRPGYNAAPKPFWTKDDKPAVEIRPGSDNYLDSPMLHGGPNAWLSEGQSQQINCDAQSLERSKNHERTALALSREEKYDQSIHYYELAYEACPDPKHLYSIAWIYGFKLQKPDLAREKFELFLEKSAGYASYENLRSEASVYLRDFESSKEVREQIVRLADQGKYDEALALIDQYKNKVPNPLWNKNAANIHFQIGIDREDLSRLEKARSIMIETLNLVEKIRGADSPVYREYRELFEMIETGINNLKQSKQTETAKSSEEEARKARRQQTQSAGQKSGQQTQPAQATGGAAATGAQQAVTTGGEKSKSEIQAEDLKGALKEQTTTTGGQSTKPTETSGGTRPQAGQATSAGGQQTSQAAATTPSAEVKPIVSVQLGYSFKRTKLSGRYEVDMRRRLREDREIVMSGNISGIYQKYGEDKRFFTLVSLDDPTFQERTIEVILDGQDAEDFKNYVNSVSVIFKKQRMGGQVMTGEVKFFEQQFAEKGNRLSYKYGRVNEAATEWLNYEYRTKWSLYGGVEWESDWVRTSDSVLTLTPPVRRRTIEISVDEDNILQNKVKAVAIQVKHSIFGKDILKEVVINYDKGDPLQVNYTYMHEEGKPGYSYRLIWLLLNGKEVSTDWINRESPFVFAVFSK